MSERAGLTASSQDSSDARVGSDARIATPPRPPRGRRPDLGGLVRTAAPAAALFLVVRAAGFVGLALVAHARGQNPWARLHAWDALWLTGIAEHGYDTTVKLAPNGHPVLTNIVFFPLMPFLMRAVSTVTGLSPYVAGLVVSVLAGVGAAVALDRIGRRLVGSRRAGLVLVALWASWPHAIVLSMAYTEALFVALAAWSLERALTRRWITAGALAALAGATRPTGVALAIALVVAAVPAVLEAVRSGNRSAAWRPVAAVLLAPLGWVVFVVWVGRALGRADGWFWMERAAWGTSVDGGGYELSKIRDALTVAGPAVFLLCALIVLGCIALFVALVLDAVAARRARETGASAWWPVVVYAGLVLAITVASAGYQHSKPRYLLTAFPLLLPLARLLDPVPRRTLLVLLGAAALASAWYGGYLLVVWTGSP